MAKSYLDKDGLLYFLQKIRPSATPSMDGTASTGTSKRFAAEDHVHPTDTTLAPKASPALTGTPTAPTATTGTATTQIATTEFVANTVGAMTSGVADVQVDNASVVTSGIAKINTFTGATSSAAGAKGLVPAPPSGAYGTSAMVLSTDGSWREVGIMGISGQGTNKSIKLSATVDGSTTGSSYTLSVASQTNSGVMSYTDKAKLDSITMTNGIIDSSVLPSFVDDVIEAYPRANQTELGSTWLATGSASGTVITPEAGKIYILMADSTSYSANSQFRWGGSAYVKMNDGGVSAITNAEIDTIVAS